jgi:hypothetical protein
MKYVKYTIPTSSVSCTNRSKSWCHHEWEILHNLGISAITHLFTESNNYR